MKGRELELAYLQKQTLYIQIILFLSVVLAFLLRILLISEYGLSEDEVLKVLATQDYRNLDFSANAQHPALMKLLITLSIILFGETEFAVRLPNVFVASLTIYPIFYLGRELFNEPTGILASLLWAVDIPAISFATIAKEDSLLTFFWILSVFYFIKSLKDIRYLQPTGICVGFAFTSKYIAIILVLFLLILYKMYHENSVLPRAKKVARICIPPALLIFFLINFPIFLPSSLVKIFNHYIIHTRPYPPRTGRIMMDNLFRFRPLYWFLLFIFVKTPILFLVILLIGIGYSVKYRTRPYMILLLWILIPLIIFSITGGFSRYILVMIPAFVLLSANGILRFSDWLVSNIPRKYKKPKMKISKGIAISIIIITCLHSFVVGIAVSPYYRMYVNELGGGSDKAGYYFPQDSVYDYYLREAIFYVNENAPENAVIAMHVPIVGKYYGRQDLDFISVTELPVNIDLWNGYKVSFVIIQESRIFFENEKQVENLQNSLSPSFVRKILETEVVEVYAI